ncbi:TPA: hypothetical protein DCL30_00040 [Candidatus Peribacteria bacterium]|nr:MAG: hypothetical protein A3J91_04635 [Candidatus Peribacteria bacterium RIFOXYC2_FULL_58_10]OGJ84360.1 MAG: hypothetical protein A2529_03115 [Candidatus Peribacteria bacterium RIFOXYD2_FULL_58_15]HAI97921.1 hypothetical protein [Candidatus Peribacteria bacterium]HAS34713.1 hypothetical protein [Candidatus Peribacteria bacterium]
MLRLRKTWAALALFSVAGLVVPLTANAYLLPEDVLLSTESLVPPRSRETRDRVTAQAKESSIRREVIQAEEFAKQHPAPVEEEEDTTADTSSQLSTTDMELLRTIRLLGRIEGRQDILMLPGAHTGAPLSPNPLAPTGAGAILTMIVMAGAVGWTLYRAHKSGRYTRIAVK